MFQVTGRRVVTDLKEVASSRVADKNDRLEIGELGAVEEHVEKEVKDCKAADLEARVLRVAATLPSRIVAVGPPKPGDCSRSVDFRVFLEPFSLKENCLVQHIALVESLDEDVGLLGGIIAMRG